MLIGQKAIVIFSGGQDSTTCLYWAKEHFTEVEAVTFDYEQRHKAEIQCAATICEHMHIPHTVLNIGLLHQLAPNALTRDHIGITKEEGQLPTTFVDGRNLLFITFSAILGKQKGAFHLVTGVCETDFSGYPDCRDVFIKSLNVTLNLGMDASFVIHTPLMWLNKAQTWALAEQFGALEVIQHQTVTCYYGIKGNGCGNCPACKLRQAGFEQYKSMCSQDGKECIRPRG